MIRQQIQREYVRTDNWSIIAKINKDKDSDQWDDVKIPNMAAGGLLFLSDIPFAAGDLLWFDLLIDPMAPGIPGKIPVKLQGEVCGIREAPNNQNAYSVEFVEISKGDRIRLDELVRMTNYKYKLDSEADIFDR